MQDDALVRRVRAAGANVVVEAVPGAGKTHLLLALAEAEPRTLLLAYNRQLAAEIQPRLPEGALCCTFHALCTRHLRPARDDAQLRAAVGDAEERGDAGTAFAHVAQVLIDEAQDVRADYVRLLRVLGLLRTGVTVVVVGDRNQLVYDWDARFPASLDVLTRPHKAVRSGVAWTRIVAATSHRLPRPVAALVADMFGVQLAAAHAGGAAVEVRCPSSAFALAAALDDLVAAPLLLLVDHKRGNRPLCALLNAWSRRGVTMHVHGTAAPAASAAPTVQCATFWSAKGLQHDTVVVLLPGRAPRNPTYVALTRCTRRLVVVLDPREPHAAFCVAAARAGGGVRATSDRAAAALRAGARDDVPRSLTRAEYGGADAAVPPYTVRAVAPDACVADMDVDAYDADEGMDAGVGVAMALAWCEVRATGVCRAVEQIFQPCRFDRAQLRAAVAHGLVARHVPRALTDDMLLAPELRACAHTAYADVRAAAGAEAGDALRDAATLLALHDVARAAEAWSGFEFVMRLPDPVVAPCDADRVAWIAAQLAEADAYDTVLRAADADAHAHAHAHAHARVHATCAARAYHVVAQVATEDVERAARIAALHPARACRLVDVAAREVRDVVV